MFIGAPAQFYFSLSHRQKCPLANGEIVLSISAPAGPAFRLAIIETDQITIQCPDIKVTICQDRLKVDFLIDTVEIHNRSRISIQAKYAAIAAA
jgi:hypothetical protein